MKISPTARPTSRPALLRSFRNTTYDRSSILVTSRFRLQSICSGSETSLEEDPRFSDSASVSTRANFSSRNAQILWTPVVPTQILVMIIGQNDAINREEEACQRRIPKAR
jgi:hypothetical protein